MSVESSGPFPPPQRGVERADPGTRGANGADVPLFIRETGKEDRENETHHAELDVGAITVHSRYLKTVENACSLGQSTLSLIKVRTPRHCIPAPLISELLTNVHTTTLNCVAASQDAVTVQSLDYGCRRPRSPTDLQSSPALLPHLLRRRPTYRPKPSSSSSAA